MGAGTAVVNTGDDPPVLFLSERRPGGARLAAWSPETRAVLWEHDVDSSNPTNRHLFPTGPGRAVLRQPAAAPGRPRLDRDRLLPIDVRRGPLAAPASTPLLRVLDPPSTLAPQLVLIDPDDTRRLVVLDGASLEIRFPMTFQGEPQPQITTDVFQGRDGFALLATTHDPPQASLWVVRGEHGQQGYSIRLDDLRRRDVQVMLVDGALLLASGGTVRVLRSSTP